MGRIAASLIWLSLGVGLGAAAAQAQDWRAAEDVQATLAGRTVDYSDAWQRFNASGKTLYHAAAPSWGNWAARGGQYCSEWPPAGGWTCYDLELSADGTRVRFVDAQGGATIGTFRPQ